MHLKYRFSENKDHQSVVLAILAGILLCLSFPSVGFWPLAWVALIPLLLAIRMVSWQRAAMLGLVFGLVLHLGLIYWIVIVLGTYGHLPWWVSFPALFLLCFCMSLYPAAFAAGLGLAMQSRISPVWVAPLLWVVLDYIRGVLFTGFPWMHLGYSQFQMPVLVQVADLTGYYGISFAIVLFNCLLFSIIFRKANAGLVARQGIRPEVIYALCLLFAFTAYNIFRFRAVEAKISQSESVKIALVQGNIRQDLKWAPALQKQTVETYIRLSRAALSEQQAELLVWPETALPFYPLESVLFDKVVASTVKGLHVSLLTGAPHREQPSPGAAMQYVNSAMLINPDGGLGGRYDKVHLVPFGEYIPLRQILRFSGPLVETIGDFTPGTSFKPIACDKTRLGVLICFEAIFPDVARAQCENGANLLVAITNDAWFGRSSAPWQHLAMATLRAVETRRSIARAANTGISAFIDPLGRVISATPVFEEAFLNGVVPLCEEKTVYVRYGDFLVIVCAAALALAALGGWLRAGRGTHKDKEEKYHVS